jgi:uncharacterized protein YcfL
MVKICLALGYIAAGNHRLFSGGGIITIFNASVAFLITSIFSLFLYQPDIIIMKKYIYLLIALFFLFSCAAKKKVVVMGSYSGGDGSSFENAVIINETHDGRGVDDEYAWIKIHYPYATNNGQALEYNGKKPYDILTITTRDNKTISVYFDISKFYGKF